MSKLIKLTESHYIIVDDSEIKEGDWYLTEIPHSIWKYDKSKGMSSSRGWNKKITHSTQPLDVKITDEGIHLPDWSKVKALSSRVVKELIGEVDVESIAEDKTNIRILRHKTPSQVAKQYFDGYVDGYNQALEDNKEKKYTEEDLRKVIEMARETPDYGDILRGFYWTEEDIIQSLHPKTEWEVEIVDGKLKLK